MDAQKFRRLLQGLLSGIADGDSKGIESSIDMLSDLLQNCRTVVQSFQDAGFMTRDEGIVVNQGPHGSVQISVVAVRNG